VCVSCSPLFGPRVVLMSSVTSEAHPALWHQQQSASAQGSPPLATLAPAQARPLTALFTTLAA
jgi:hypothetical protein